MSEFPIITGNLKKENLPDDIRTIDDLNKLPYLTKDIIRENFSELFDRTLIGKKTRLNQTSGSTGELCVIIELLMVFNKLGGGYRGWNWGGTNLGINVLCSDHQS